MKPLALAALCIGLLALGIAMILAAWLLLNIFPQGLVVLILAAFNLLILKSLIRILSRQLGVPSVSGYR